MKTYFVRHADALPRVGEMTNAERPLSPNGELQAYELAAFFEEQAVSSIISSPALRCRATIGPLAESKGLPVTSLANLDEGLNPQTLLKLLETPSTDNAVICSHGDMIPGALRLLEMRGCNFPGGSHRCAKGSIWTIELQTDFTGTAIYSAGPT